MIGCNFFCKIKF